MKINNSAVRSRLPLLITVLYPPYVISTRTWSRGCFFLLFFAVLSPAPSTQVVVVRSRMGRFDIACNHFWFAFGARQIKIVVLAERRLCPSGCRLRQIPCVVHQEKRRREKKRWQRQLVWWDLRRWDFRDTGVHSGRYFGGEAAVLCHSARIRARSGMNSSI